MRKALAERLKEGLVEGIEHVRGERTLVTQTIDAPPSRDYTGEQVAAIRKRHGLSQAAFARVLRVSVKTLQSWEQGVRKPSRPTMRLLQVFDEPSQFSSLLRSLT